MGERRAWLAVGGLVVALGCAGGATRVAPTPAPSATSATASAAIATSAASSASSAAPVVDIVPGRPATIGDDAATTARRRVATAVVLFGVRDLVKEHLVRFQPVLCVVNGALTDGLACSQAMPQSSTVRLTHATSTMPRTTTLTRAARGYKDDAGGRTYRAPLEPACCMYNTCVGETHAFFASPAIPEADMVLAIWPADAEIDLVPRDGSVDSISVKNALSAAGAPAKLSVTQAFRAGALSVVAATGRYGAQLSTDEGKGPTWSTEVLTQARRIDVLATTDLDHDGNVEGIVYEAWANDYGVSVFGNRWATPRYRFSCGNI